MCDHIACQQVQVDAFTYATAVCITFFVKLFLVIFTFIHVFLYIFGENFHIHYVIVIHYVQCFLKDDVITFCAWFSTFILLLTMLVYYAM